MCVVVAVLPQSGGRGGGVALVWDLGTEKGGGITAVSMLIGYVHIPYI